MTIKKIGVGSDHAGVNLKNKIAEFLKEKGYEVTDYGTNSTAYDEYTPMDFFIIVSECTTCQTMFNQNYRIKSVEFRGESRKVTTFYYAFNTASKGTWGYETSLHTIKNLYFDSCTNISSIFGNSFNLTTIEGFYNLGMAVSKETEYYSN